MLHVAAVVYHLAHYHSLSSFLLGNFEKYERQKNDSSGQWRAVIPEQEHTIAMARSPPACALETPEIPQRRGVAEPRCFRQPVCGCSSQGSLDSYSETQQYQASLSGDLFENPSVITRTFLCAALWPSCIAAANSSTPSSPVEDASRKTSERS